MEFTAIEQLIMAYAPMLVTIIGIIISFLKMVAIIKQLKNDTTKSDAEKTETINALKAQFDMVVNQNYELKKQINELLTKIDRIERS